MSKSLWRAEKDSQGKWCVMFDSVHGDICLTHAMNEGQARMIAAAPEMLAALWEVEEYLEPRIDADDGVPNDAMRLLTEVREALKKARP